MSDEEQNESWDDLFGWDADHSTLPTWLNRKILFREDKKLQWEVSPRESSTLAFLALCVIPRDTAKKVLIKYLIRCLRTEPGTATARRCNDERIDRALLTYCKLQNDDQWARRREIFLRPEHGNVDRPAISSPSDSGPASANGGACPAKDPATRGAERRAAVEDILARKAWSLLDLANAAVVDNKTVVGYLTGKTRRIHPKTRKRLADALGLDPAKLPR